MSRPDIHTRIDRTGSGYTVTVTDGTQVLTGEAFSAEGARNVGTELTEQLNPRRHRQEKGKR